MQADKIGIDKTEKLPGGRELGIAQRAGAYCEVVSYKGPDANTYPDPHDFDWTKYKGVGFSSRGSLVSQFGEEILDKHNASRGIHRQPLFMIR